MNKTEKIICILLGAVLAWYLYTETKANAKAAAEAAAKVEKMEKAGGGGDEVERVGGGGGEVEKAGGGGVAKFSLPEKTVSVENDLVRLELTSHGAAVKSVLLKKYARGLGEVSAENPAVTLDFSAQPMGAADDATDFELVGSDATSATFRNASGTRRIALGENYRIVFEDELRGASTMSIGSMRMGDSKNDLLSVDSWAKDAGKGKPGVIHHGDDDSPLKAYLAGGLVGGCSGCSGSRAAADMPRETEIAYPGAQTWIALKNRFFVTAFVSSTQPNGSFAATVSRDVASAAYRPEAVRASVRFAGESEGRRTTVFYAGPKKQSLLWDLGMKDVMEFGMWRWICYPLVWVLNLFNDWIPNYGVAIILLTILVRILFWPLTHKSTVGMKKMGELQPKMKAIQEKFKDNPQRLQQETWALYKSEKVNPMSSCLPMLIQIPVFIALFNVLRSAVELRYAPFLWIADLSEPEGLFASWFPFGGLNLLPILMAVSTALQSYFTPSAGDKSQQRMMMIMMPAMMLVMFYSFPSALSLYWFLSNLFSIVQMYLIRRQTAKQRGGALVPEVIDPPTTRQMKRHS